jgi:multiple sugar transport system substrate-binding protein
MFIDADHMAEAFENPDKSQVVGKVGYAVPPEGPNGEPPKTNVWAWSIAMSAASKNKTAAWLWLQWASSKDILTRTAVKGNINPCRVSVANSKEVSDYMKNWGDYQKTYVYLLDKVVAMRWAPMKEQAEVGDRWSVAVQEVLLNEKSAKDALDSAAADINKIIEKAGYKKAQ